MSDWVGKLLLVMLPATPALGALLAGFLPDRYPRLIRGIGWGFSIGVLAVWILLRALLPGGEGLLISLKLPWVSQMGIGLHLGLDGIGFMMAGMISVVGVAAVVGTLPSTPELNRSHVVCLLLAEAGMLGTVAAWDLILFIAFWEVTLVPFFFLMGRGPGRAGTASATRFFVTSVVSSVLMWVGVLWLVQIAGSPWTFDLVELPARLARGSDLPAGCAWLFAATFMMRMAALPLNTWFPLAVSSVPTAAGILLAGGVLPLGGFGLVHVVQRVFGSQLASVEHWFGLVGVVTALAGGLASLVQRDLKRLLAYVCLSQVGLALSGLCFPDIVSREAGMMMLVASGLGASGLFLFAGVVCQARGSQRISEISGLWRSHPAFAGMAFAGVASAAAVPGTLGFVGAFQVLHGMVSDWLSFVLAGSAILVTGSSVIWAYRRILGGSFHSEMWVGSGWPRKRETGILALLMMIIILAGLLPGLVKLASTGARQPIAKSRVVGLVHESQPRTTAVVVRVGSGP